MLILYEVVTRSMEASWCVRFDPAPAIYFAVVDLCMHMFKVSCKRVTINDLDE